MKMHYAELQNRSRLLQSLTGFNTTESEALLPSFSAAWETFEEDTFERALTLSGNDVICRISIEDTLATQGGQLVVPTLEGMRKVSVPAGIKSGAKLRIQHKGWSTVAGERRYQYIHIEVKSPPIVSTPCPKPVKSYSPEVVQEVFRSDNYATLSDNEQGKLAEMLEKAEIKQQQKKQYLTSTQKTQSLALLTSGWVWLAVALGCMVTYGGLRVIPQLLPSPSAPIEQPIL